MYLVNGVRTIDAMQPNYCRLDFLTSSVHFFGIIQMTDQVQIGCLGPRSIVFNSIGVHEHNLFVSFALITV